MIRDDYERQRRENFDGYLRKPVLKKERLEELFKHLDYHVGATLDVHQDKRLANGNEVTLKDKALVDVFANEFLSSCQSLQKNNQINGIMTFSNTLAQWANSYNEPELVTFAEELNLAAEVFDIAKIKILLSAFARQCSEVSYHQLD